MKKITILTSLLVVPLLLGACGNQDTKKATQDTSSMVNNSQNSDNKASSSTNATSNSKSANFKTSSPEKSKTKDDTNTKISTNLQGSYLNTMHIAVKDDMGKALGTVNLPVILYVTGNTLHIGAGKPTVDGADPHKLASNVGDGIINTSPSTVTVKNVKNGNNSATFDTNQNQGLFIQNGQSYKGSITFNYNPSNKTATGYVNLPNNNGNGSIKLGLEKTMTTTLNSNSPKGYIYNDSGDTFTKISDNQAKKILTFGIQKASYFGYKN